MSSPREETLSPDELRKRLYQTFKNRGVLDTLKVSRDSNAVVFCAYLATLFIVSLDPHPVSAAEPAHPRAETTVPHNHRRLGGQIGAPLVSL